MYFKLQQYQEAKEAWEKGLVLLPTDEMTQDNLIECIYDNPEVPEEIREISSFMRKYLQRALEEAILKILFKHCFQGWCF